MVTAESIKLDRIPAHARRSAVSRAGATPRTLEVLAADPDPGIRLAVASHPATPTAALLRLAADPVAAVAGVAALRSAARRLTEDLASY